ncbi:loganic acid O-methyltransferase-like [Salvia splendens]|uniref:loganic acid O-methyltransferase-like n=1 Tax=Salvia splendens TaxID=180675 RepID=UPI001C26B851|nr:loganic acid O-methyltransferase-like [Salvia splendens]
MELANEKKAWDSVKGMIEEAVIENLERESVWSTVVRAYSDQFKKDFEGFLASRVVELVRGGVLLLLLPATREGVPSANYPTGFLFSYLGQTLMDLANEGVVEKAKIDGFNLPIYVPSVGEMRKMIEKNGCFTIEKMELTVPRGKTSIGCSEGNDRRSSDREPLDAEPRSTKVAIADLGCSVGPNTFFTVQNLIEAVQKKWPSETLLEFQVFFNDHLGNDFNTLFSSLPLERRYHAAAVPGSFHGRLFPRSSITVAHSSYALQWLSKKPQGVHNEGRIHYSGAGTDVVKAYSDQYEKDLSCFMSARAEEIVKGGVLVVVMPGTPDGISHSDHPAGVLFNYFGYSLMELANEGVVDKDKIDKFNLPIYTPTMGEMKRVIENNGCFSIEKMELSKMDGPIDVAKLIMHMRAGMEGVFSAHFGDSVVDKMFAKMSDKAQDMSHFFESGYSKSTQLLVVLKRK